MTPAFTSYALVDPMAMDFGPAHFRGSADAGRVVKDYSVGDPSGVPPAGGGDG